VDSPQVPGHEDAPVAVSSRACKRHMCTALNFQPWLRSNVESVGKSHAGMSSERKNPFSAGNYHRIRHHLGIKGIIPLTSVVRSFWIDLILRDWSITADMYMDTKLRIIENGIQMEDPYGVMFAQDETDWSRGTHCA